MNQTNLLENIVKFNNKYKPKTKEDKDKKRNTFDNFAFRSGIFPIKTLQRKGPPGMLAFAPSDLTWVDKVSDLTQLKIFTPKNKWISKRR